MNIVPAFAFQRRSRGGTASDNMAKIRSPSNNSLRACLLSSCYTSKIVELGVVEVQTDLPSSAVSALVV